jgi:chemotaxis protein MotA
MLYFVALAIASLSIFASMVHLQQTFASYWDAVAFFVVFGGTLAVALATLPFSVYHEIRDSFKRLVRLEKWDTKDLAKDCIDLVQSVQSNAGVYQPKSQGLSGEVLKDGFELIALGFTPEKITDILAERIHQSWERSQRVANALRSLAKYPPAFGLTGTVLGLVTLMRSVSEGAGARETGLQMAIALVATMYGLLVANLVINPAGESILKFAVDEKKRAEMAVQGVVLAAQRVPLLEAQESLNSYLSKPNRINLLAAGGPEGNREAA